MTSETPRYYRHYATPVRLEIPLGGGYVAYSLDWRTGQFVEDNAKIDDVLWAQAGEIGKISYEGFVTETEALRRKYLRGDGPIFALYGTVDAMMSVAREEGRDLARAEVDLIRALHKRTFKMWEEEFARRDAGEPPSFTYTTVLPPQV